MEKEKAAYSFNPEKILQQCVHSEKPNTPRGRSKLTELHSIYKIILHQTS